MQTYDRAIQIMAMLLVGFGFLMVFLKKYGRSALTATFLIVSAAIPLYMVLDSAGIFGGATAGDVNKLVLAEFAAASLLVCAGACLGRLKMHQYIVLAVLFIPLYMLNEWILCKNGLRIIARGTFLDTGGSIIIHAFGALFGLGVAMAVTQKKEAPVPVESDYTSDRFSMLGSMVLRVFWPGFCAAMVAPELVAFTAVNVIIALCGSTLATYLMSVGLKTQDKYLGYCQCLSGRWCGNRGHLCYPQPSDIIPDRYPGRGNFNFWIRSHSTQAGKISQND